MKRRLLALVLVLSMAFTGITPAAFALENQEEPAELNFEEPISEDPVIEEPVDEDPIIEEPIVEEPVVEDPVIEEPVIEEPVEEEPVEEEPVIEEPEEDIIEAAGELEEELPEEPQTAGPVSGTYVSEYYSGPSDAELFDAYAKRAFDRSLGISWSGPDFEVTPSSTSILGDNTLDRDIYDAVKAELAKVAAGTLSTAQFTLSNSTYCWTFDELGITDAVNNGEITAEADAAMDARIAIIYDCLLADCPLELYWHDKTKGVGWSYSVIETGSTVYLEDVLMVFCVSKDYSATNEHKTFDADTAKTGAAALAVANAQDIVSANSAKDDEAKLRAYLDAITGLVEYDHTAADNGSDAEGMDHWQIVYVFDENTSTNVVCEGYAKAFQYLCDLSTFEKDIECHTVWGVMTGGTGSGGHMWNVVTMDDGKNYLVDVTNCDSGSAGAPDQLFIAPAASSADANQTHVFSTTSGNITFEYDVEMEDLFCEGYLAISDTAYSAAPGEPSIEFTELSDKVSTMTAFDAEASLTLKAIAEGKNLADGDSISWQWYTCDNVEKENPAAIEGAASSTYTLSGNKDVDAVYLYAKVSNSDSSLTAETDVFTVYIVPEGYTAYGNKNTVMLWAPDEVEPENGKAEGVNISAEGSKITVELDNAALYASNYGLYMYNGYTDNRGTVRDVTYNLSGTSYVTSVWKCALMQNGNDDTVVTFGGSGELHLKSHKALFDMDGANVVLKNSAKLYITDYSRTVSSSPSDIRSLAISGTAELNFDCKNGLKIVSCDGSGFVVAQPEGGYVNSTGMIVNSDGTVATTGKLVKPAPGVKFVKYPALTYSVAKGGTVTLNAQAAALGIDDPAITYTWYDEGGNSIGTGASFAYKAPAERGTYKVKCVASITEDGTEYTAEGEVITISAGVRTNALDLTNMASTDMLTAEGWKWDADARLLTLKDFYSNTQTKLPENSTVYVTPGSTNVINTTTNYPAFYVDVVGTDDLNITGSGKLKLNRGEGDNWTIIHIGYDNLIFTGADVEIVCDGKPSTGTLFYAESVTLNGTKFSAKWKGDYSSGLIHDTALYGCEITKGSISSGNSVYGVYNSESGYTELEIQPKGMYFDTLPNRITKVSLGSTVELTANAVSASEGKVSYKWYKTDSFSSPSPTNSVEVGNAAKLSLKTTERGASYYYCVATCGEESTTSSVFCVAVGAKGKLPVTDAVTLSSTSSMDKLSSEGWKWDHTTGTLTLADAEFVSPFESNTVWAHIASKYNR